MHRSKRKGDRIERELVALHREAGIEAQRVPLSGAAGGLYSGDLVIQAPTCQLKAEVKARASGDGFMTLEGWLGESLITRGMSRFLRWFCQTRQCLVAEGTGSKVGEN